MMTSHRIRFMAGAATLLLGAVVWASSVTAAEPAASHTAAMPAYGAWHSSRIGGGGYLQHVVFCPSDAQRMYLAVDVGGLYRSDDGGLNWRMLHGTLPARAGNYSVAGISVHPQNADEVVIAAGSRWAAPEGVYRSKDGGNSWQQTLPNAWFMADGPNRADGHVLVRSPQDPSLLLAASIGGGLFRSIDGGATWTHVGLTDLLPTAVVFDRADPKHVWLCATERPKMSAHGGSVAFHGGLYESRDAGQSWQQVADLAPREFVQDPSDPARLYGIFGDEPPVKISTDAGRTWMPYSQGLPPRKKKSDYRDQGLFRTLAIGPDFVLAGASDGAIYRLNRAGERWETVQRQSVEVGDWFGPAIEPMSRRFGAAMGFLAIDPRDPKHWCITDWYALYQSRDAGRNWRLTLNGIEATVIHAVRAGGPNGHVIHMGMGDNGYFRSTDGGASFALSPSKVGVGNNVKDIAVSPVASDRVYAVGPDTFGWFANHVFISDDAGLTWRRSAMKGLPDMSKHRCNSIAAGVHSADEVWLAVSGKVGRDAGGVYRSADGGQNWQWVGEGLPQDKAFFRGDIWVVGRELAIGPDGAAMCASHTIGQVYRLDDPASGSWRPCPKPGPGKPQDLIAGSAAGEFYLAARDGGLYATADHGRHWERRHNDSVHHVALDPRNPRRLAAATDDGVILSQDAGRHWRVLDPSLPYRVARLPLCFAGDRLIVGTAGCGVFWMDLNATRNEP